MNNIKRILDLVEAEERAAEQNQSLADTILEAFMYGEDSSKTYEGALCILAKELREQKKRLGAVAKEMMEYINQCAKMASMSVATGDKAKGGGAI